MSHARSALRIGLGTGPAGQRAGAAPVRCAGTPGPPRGSVHVERPARTRDCSSAGHGRSRGTRPTACGNLDDHRDSGGERPAMAVASWRRMLARAWPRSEPWQLRRGACDAPRCRQTARGCAAPQGCPGLVKEFGPAARFSPSMRGFSCPLTPLSAASSPSRFLRRWPRGGPWS